MICIDCIGDEYLRQFVNEHVSSGKCSYCEKTTQVVSLEMLSEIADDFLRRFCCQGVLSPRFHGDSDSPYYEQEGLSLVNLVEEELEIGYQAAEDLSDLLIEGDPAIIQDGDEPFYSDECQYQRNGMGDWNYAQIWDDFSVRIKHERRFFDDDSRSLLSEILGSPDSKEAKELPIITIGPGSRVENLYRARRAETEKNALKIIKSPESELGPPPPSKASAGRMNPAGISVFYGAVSEGTAIAEVRPPVGSYIVIGEFLPSHELRLLDLSQIGIGFTGSIFSPEYENRAQRLRFLEGFHTLIAKPILPHDELLDYIPTQAVAEYVSNVLGLDGILFASAQLGAVPDVPEPSHYVTPVELDDEELGTHNVVILGSAAKLLAKETENHLEPTLANASTTGCFTLNDESVTTLLVKGVSYSHDPAYIYDENQTTPESLLSLPLSF